MQGFNLFVFECAEVQLRTNYVSSATWTIFNAYWQSLVWTNFNFVWKTSYIYGELVSTHLYFWTGKLSRMVLGHFLEIELLIWNSFGRTLNTDRSSVQHIFSRTFKPIQHLKPQKSTVSVAHVDFKRCLFCLSSIWFYLTYQACTVLLEWTSIASYKYLFWVQGG